MLGRILVLAVFVAAFLIQGSYSKGKTAKEWAAFNRKKLADLENEERELMTKSLGNDVPIEKPGMVFATFGPGYSKDEKQTLASKYSGQLQSAGVRVNIFETGPDKWVLATFRTYDTFDVVKFLRQQPEVMITTLDTSDYWNLPKYQREYTNHQEEKDREEKEKIAKDAAKKAKEEEARREKEAKEKRAKEQASVDLDAKEL